MKPQRHTSRETADHKYRKSDDRITGPQSSDLEVRHDDPIWAEVAARSKEALAADYPYGSGVLIGIDTDHAADFAFPEDVVLALRRVGEQRRLAEDAAAQGLEGAI